MRTLAMWYSWHRFSYHLFYFYEINQFLSFFIAVHLVEYECEFNVALSSSCVFWLGSVGLLSPWLGSASFLLALTCTYLRLPAPTCTYLHLPALTCSIERGLLYLVPRSETYEGSAKDEVSPKPEIEASTHPWEMENSPKTMCSHGTVSYNSKL